MISRVSLTAVVLSASLVGIGCDVPRPSHPAEGRRMGQLPIMSFNDPPAPVPSLAGKVTLLNFWGTWCPPCRKELPGLVRLAQRLADEPRFQLVAVSIGSGGDDTDLPRETTSFLAAQKMPIAAWGFSEAVAATHFSLAFDIGGVPTTYLIGPDSRVRRVWTGYRSSDEAAMATAILGLLKEMPDAGPTLTPAPRP
jgi:cytochrome c biogenesis protein CcmG/thiol:disulfide interchange protein DsbE